MKQERKIVIDFGLPRTASKFRQYYFIQHPQVKAIRFFLMGAMEQIITSKKPVFISDEGLYYHRKYRGKPSYAVSAMKTLFPQAKAMVVTRPYDSWVRSMYHQYVQGGSSGVLSFLEYQKQFSPLFMDHKDFVKCLQKHFDEVLVLDFEDFKKDNTRFLTDICKYLGVDYVYTDMSRSNSSFSPRAISFFRWINRNPKPVHMAFRYVCRMVRRYDETH